MSGIWRKGMATAMLLLAGTVVAQPLRPPAERMGPQRMMQEEQQPARTDDEPLQRRQRMSPEERRQLRRDVHDAGRDLYREQMRERRRQMHRE